MSGPVGGALGLGKRKQRAKALHQLAINFVIFDDNVESIFQFGQQSSHRHRIKFRKMAEQAGIVGKSAGLPGLEPQHIGEDLA